MSYLYSFYNCFSPYTQPLYSLYSQNPLQNTLQQVFFTNTSDSQVEIKNAEKFEPILVSAPTTCQTMSFCELKGKPPRQEKQIKKESPKNKDENFGWRNQNKDRNMISSILKGFVHQVLQEKCMIKLIEELSKKRQLENGVSSYYQFMSSKFPVRKSYVGLRYMQEILTSNPAKDHMTFILSITLKHYLKAVYPLNVIRAAKMKKRNRIALLKKARMIQGLLFDR